MQLMRSAMIQIMGCSFHQCTTGYSIGNLIFGPDGRIEIGKTIEKIAMNTTVSDGKIMD